MGYTTDFEGEFKTDKKVDEETYNLLKGIANTRRMARNVDKKYGVEGEFYCEDKEDFGQRDNRNIIDYNRPPSTQPSLWCQWEIQEDRQTIKWDENENFYNYVDWIKYFIDKILKPKGYKLNGEVTWQGEESNDMAMISIKDNKVTIVR